MMELETSPKGQSSTKKTCLSSAFSSSTIFNKNNIALKQIDLTSLNSSNLYLIKDSSGNSSLSATTFSSKPAFLLENVLTPKECQSLISFVESDVEFNPALVTIGDSGYQITSIEERNNYEAIIYDDEFVTLLWDRISSFIPDIFENRPTTGLHEKLRFIRYDPGQKFGPHRDGCVRRRNKVTGSSILGQVGMMTVQFYLNDGFIGGETTFLGWNNNNRVEIQPKTGMALIFEKSLLHEGSELKSGRKYTFITDVMYKEVELEELHQENNTNLSRKLTNCAII